MNILIDGKEGSSQTWVASGTAKGFVLVNNTEYPINISTTLFQLTIPACYILVGPAVPNMQFIATMDAGIGVPVLGIEGVTYNDSTVSIGMSLYPIYSVVMNTVDVTGNMDATITNSVIDVNPASGATFDVAGSVDSNITNAVIPVSGSVDANILNATLSVSGSVDSNITNATLPVSGSVDATITNATLNMAQASGATFAVSGSLDANITNSQLTITPASGTVFETSITSSTVIPIANESGGSLTVVGTVSSTITNSELTISPAAGSTFNTAISSSTVIPIANASGGSLTVAGTVDANITNATIDVVQGSGTVFNTTGSVDANITNATLTVVQNSGATFDVAGSVSANITNALLAVSGSVDANITNATLEVTQSSGATFDVSGTLDANITNASISANVINEQIPIGANVISPKMIATIASSSGGAPVTQLVTPPNTISMDSFVLVCVSSGSYSYSSATVYFYLTIPGTTNTYNVGTVTLTNLVNQNPSTFGETATAESNWAGNLPIVFDAASIELTAVDSGVTDTVDCYIAANGLAVTPPFNNDNPQANSISFIRPNESIIYNTMENEPVPFEPYEYWQPLGGRHRVHGSREKYVFFNALPSSNYQDVDLPAMDGESFWLFVYNGTNQDLHVLPLIVGSSYAPIPPTGGTITFSNTITIAANAGATGFLTGPYPNIGAYGTASSSTVQIVFSTGTAPTTGSLYMWALPH